MVGRILAATVIGVTFFLTMLMDDAIAVEESGKPQPENLIVDDPSSILLGSRTFVIPFTVNEKPGQPVDVHLFLMRPNQSSAGDGQGPAAMSPGPQRPDVLAAGISGPNQWNWIESKLASHDGLQEFEFTATSDGEYWFTTQVTEHDSEKPSATLGDLPPQQKIRVDTTEPFIEMTADSDGDGRIELAAAIRDASPIDQMLLRYITDEMTQWVSVDPASISKNETATFDVPGDWTQISIELVVKDRAGNQGTSRQRVRRPRVADAVGPRYADAGLSPTNPHRFPFFPRQDANTNRLDGSDTTAGPVPRSYQPPAATITNRYRTVPSYPAPQSSHYPVPNDPVIRLDRKQSAGPSRQTQTPSAQQALSPPAQSSSPSHFSPLRPLPATGLPQLTRPPVRDGATPARPAAQRIGSGNRQGFPVILNSNGDDPLDLDARAPVGAASSDAGSASRTPALVPETIPAPAPEPDPKAKLTQQRARSVEEALQPIGSASSVPETSVGESTRDSGPDVQSARPSFESAPSRSFSSAEILSRVPVRFSDNKRFSLDYVLEAVGSRGVEAVDLYGSVDEGQSWKLWGRDPDRQSPFDIETREEGVFSYRIVVVGRNGLASARPLAGDLPDIVVIVDTQPPQVRISGASYGQGDQIGSLVIQYECRDQNLKERPITLSYAESVDGPWTTIAGGLVNAGQYAWPADPSLPRAFYLRVDAIDKAGNQGTAILDRPIDAQGLAPRARIRGFQSLSGS